MESILIRGEIRDATGQMHPRMNALIHAWGKYPWMINLHEFCTIVRVKYKEMLLQSICLAAPLMKSVIE